MPQCHKWVACIAAVLLFFTISIPVVARAAGFANVVEFWEHAKAHLLPGDQVDQGDITFIYNGELVQYDSVASFLKNEKLDIMYPRSLPEGVTIEVISVENRRDEDFKVSFSLSDGSSVVVNGNHTVLDKDHPFFVTQNGLLFYIIHENYAVYFAEDYQYTVFCEDEQLMKIIMEEIY